MAIDMTYQHNFFNGLRASIEVVPQLRPPLFKELTQQPHIDLTTTPNTPRERGTKRKNSEGNTTRQNQRSKGEAMTCAIAEDQKKLVEECCKVAKAKNQTFNVTKLMKCMGYGGKRLEFQKHLKLEDTCMRLAIMGFCDDGGC